MTALHAVECALVSVDANDGIKVNTRRMWRLASQRHIPHIITITRLDAEHADFATALASIKAEFGNRCIPLFVPQIEAGKITGIHSVLHDTDVRVTLLDGKTHSVDSKEIAFVTAGRHVFKKAFLECNPVPQE